MRSEDLLAAGLCDAVRKGEAELLSQQLLDVRASDVLGLLNLNHLQDLKLVSSCTLRTTRISYVNLPEARAVTGGHVLVESLNGVCSRHFAVLLVHVVSAAAGVVADPDAKVLDLCGPLLGDLFLV